MRGVFIKIKFLSESFLKSHAGTILIVIAIIGHMYAKAQDNSLIKIASLTLFAIGLLISLGLLVYEVHIHTKNFFSKKGDSSWPKFLKGFLLILFSDLGFFGLTGFVIAIYLLFSAWQLYFPN